MRRKKFSISGGAFSFLVYYCLFKVLLSIIVLLLTQSGMSIDTVSVSFVTPTCAAVFTARRIVDKTFQRPKGWGLFGLALLCALFAAIVETILFAFQYAEFDHLTGGQANKLFATVIVGGIVLGIFKFFLIWLMLWLAGVRHLRRLQKDPHDDFHDGSDGLEEFNLKRTTQRIEPDF